MLSWTYASSLVSTIFHEIKELEVIQKTAKKKNPNKIKL